MSHAKPKDGQPDVKRKREEVPSLHEVRKHRVQATQREWRDQLRKLRTIRRSLGYSPHPLTLFDRPVIFGYT